jgi:hypothetical protein
VRETAICRVAVLNKAWYEWDSHSPILEAAEGNPLIVLIIPSEHVEAYGVVTQLAHIQHHSTCVLTPHILHFTSTPSSK